MPVFGGFGKLVETFNGPSLNTGTCGMVFDGRGIGITMEGFNAGCVVDGETPLAFGGPGSVEEEEDGLEGVFEFFGSSADVA